MVAWIFAPTLANPGRVLGIYNSASVANRDQWALLINGSGTVLARAADTVGQTQASSSANISTGVWQHVGATFGSTTSRAAFANGANKGTNATSKTITAPDRVSAGQQDNAGGTRENLDSSNLVAELCLWNVVLSDPEMARLAAGANPLSIQPAALVAYWPLIGDWNPEIDIITGPNGQNFILNGTNLVKADHPPAQLLPYYNVGTQPDMFHPGRGVFNRARFFKSPRAAGVLQGQAALSVTLADATLAAAAKLAIAGTLSQTLANVTLSSAATVKIVAALAVTLANATLSSAAQLQIKAALAATLADVTLSSVAQAQIRAALAATLDDATLASIAQSVIHGDLGVTLEDAVLIATGNDGWIRRGRAGGSWANVPGSSGIWTPVAGTPTTWTP